MGRRWGIVALFVLMACAGIGFVVGITDGVPRSLPVRPIVASPAEESGEVLPARSYAQMRQFRVGANRQFASRVADLEPQTSADIPGNANSKRLSLVRRARGRAYEGAPPVIPHSVEPMSSDACRSCHQLGVQLGQALASRIPHQSLSECQQCHVAASPLEEPSVLSESRFEGRPAPLAGDRAWDGAPPTIPHPTLMRENCLSCHGVHGSPGMQTSHPERVNCNQCHASSAELDRMPGSTQRFLGDRLRAKEPGGE
jgi:cytochrome c-type protein NapB